MRLLCVTMHLVDSTIDLWEPCPCIANNIFIIPLVEKDPNLVAIVQHTNSQKEMYKALLIQLTSIAFCIFDVNILDATFSYHWQSTIFCCSCGGDWVLLCLLETRHCHHFQQFVSRSCGVDSVCHSIHIGLT